MGRFHSVPDRLLGAHNVKNILLGASVCLGALTLAQVARELASWSRWSTA